MLELLDEIVLRSGRTRKEIERKLGVSRGFLRRLLNGETDLKIRHVLDLCRVLGVSPQQFFGQIYPRPLDEARFPTRVRLPELKDILPSWQDRPRTLKERKDIRSIFQEELAKLGIVVPPRSGAPADDEPSEP